MPTSMLEKPDPGGTKNSGEVTGPLERRQRGITEVESVLNRSLRNENDLLRCQLNDLIAREKAQRIELQRLRQHRDAEVSSMVQSATTQLKAEVEQLKSMLQSTSGQLLQALSEREQARSQKEQCARVLEETKQAAAAQESQLTQRLQSLEEAFKKGLSLAVTLADSVDAFQRHVLPTFKPTGFELKKVVIDVCPDTVVEGKALLEQLTRLENGLTLLHVIVDAKNDTLVLIRGKLKQENEELKAELQAAQEAKQGSQPQSKSVATPLNDDSSGERNVMLRQELQSLQGLFNEEVNQLKSKLKMYESEEQQGQGRLMEVQKELTALQNKLSNVEASRASLEASLKEEQSARSQLVSQLFTLRKVGDTELASKLARARLQQLALQDSGAICRNAPTQSALNGPNLSVKASAPCNLDLPTTDFMQGGLQGTQSLEMPFKDEIMNCAELYANSLPTKVV